MQEKIIKVYLAINDADMMKQCARVLKHINNVCIVGANYRPEEAFQRIKRCKPDIVVAEVLMPEMDGYTLLELLEEKLGSNMPDFMMCYTFLPEALSALGNSPYIIQCHAFPIKDSILTRQFKTGFEYFLRKHELQRYRLANVGQGVLNEEGAPYDDNLKNPQRVKRIVSYELKLMGADESYKGYKYLDRTLNKMVLSGNPAESIMKLYQELGEEDGISYQNVERNMRTCINNIWKQGNREYLRDVWGYGQINSVNKPTNSQFVAHITQMLLREYIW